MNNKRYKYIASLLAMLTAILALVAVPVSASASTGFTVSGSRVLYNNEKLTPDGQDIFDFGNGQMTFARGEWAKVSAEIRAAAGAWHGNVIRIQVEQDAYLYGSNGQSAQVFRDKVNTAINYSEEQGLGVVINDTTEATGGIFTHNELGPTAATVQFWKEIGRQSDPRVILDVFNEPRWPQDGQLGDWNLLFNGGDGYIGENALIRDLRNLGYHNQLWMEATGNEALTELGVTWPRYRLTDPDNNLVYAYHHTAVDQATDPSVTEWNVQFGNLVTKDHVAVEEGEWTNRSNPPGTGGKVFEPSGDIGQCWGNAPTSVPAYLSYLQAHGIGMIVWALGPGPAYQQYDMLNADGDDSTFTTANNYSNWAGCMTPPGGHTSGAGQLIMNFFAAGR